MCTRTHTHTHPHTCARTVIDVVVVTVVVVTDYVAAGDVVTNGIALIVVDIDDVADVAPDSASTALVAEA